MIKVVSDKQEVEKLIKIFHDQLASVMTDSVLCWVGYPGGSFEDTVMYSPELDIWLSHIGFNQENKFWNGFGIGRPIERKNNSLVGEINFPHSGIKRTIAGAFGIEDDGTILVLHRGKIGGGKPGIGKAIFTDNFRGDYVKAIDGDRETSFCLVGELYSQLFPFQVSTFIHEIQRIKKILTTSNISDFDYLLNFVYTAESSGTSISERNEPNEVIRTHGIIVNALAAELRERGIQHANDRNRDLYIHDSRKITSLFEVKVSSATQNLYSAVGQLLIYSIPIRNPVKLIAVLPDQLSEPVVNRFAELGISVLYYRIEKGVPKFIDLDSML